MFVAPERRAINGARACETARGHPLEFCGSLTGTPARFQAQRLLIAMRRPGLLRELQRYISPIVVDNGALRGQQEACEDGILAVDDDGCIVSYDTRFRTCGGCCRARCERGARKSSCVRCFLSSRIRPGSRPGHSAPLPKRVPALWARLRGFGNLVVAGWTGDQGHLCLRGDLRAPSGESHSRRVPGDEAVQLEIRAWRAVVRQRRISSPAISERSEAPLPLRERVRD